ncbi:MAG: hypothetical protein ACREIC_26370 [Limisphaerales bacterium]
MEDNEGEDRPGLTWLETAQAMPEPIVAEEPARLTWTQLELTARPKGDSMKLVPAPRLR